MIIQMGWPFVNDHQDGLFANNHPDEPANNHLDAPVYCK